MKRWHLVNVANFQAIGRASYALDDVTFLLGANEAGKSSTLDAIRWCLSGLSRGLDRAGRGAAKLVRHGAKGAGVDIEGVDADGVKWTFGRYVGASGGVRTLFWPGAWRSEGEAPHVDGEEAVAGLSAVLGCSAEVLGVVLDGSTFLRGAPVDQKAMLLRLLDLRVSDGDHVYTLDALDAAEERARQTRLETKRLIQELGVVQPPALRAFTSADEVEGRLVAARAELEAKIASSASGRERSDALAAERAGLLRDANLRDWVATAERERVPVVEMLTGLIERSMEQVDVFREHLAECRGDGDNLEALEGAAAVRRQDAVVARATSDRVKAFAGKTSSVCVLSDAVPCKTSALSFRRALAALEDEATAAAEAASAAEQCLIAARERVRQSEALEEKIEFEETFQRIAGEGIAAARRIAAIDEELASLAGVDLSEARAAVARLESELKSARLAEADRVRYEKASARLAGYQAALAKAEADVSKFGPNGIRVQALEGAISQFLERLNAATSRLSGGRHQVAITLEPWRVTVDGRDPVLLSASALLRVSTVVQAAIAEITGIGLVLVDAADCLDEGNTAAFAEAVDTWATGGSQVVIAATRPRGVVPSWGRAYWVGDGGAALVPRADGPA